MTSSNSDMSICNISRLQQDLTSKKEEVKQISEELNKLNARKRKLVKELKSIEEELDFLSGHESSHSQFEGDQFPWSREMMLKLKSVFKIDTFRSHQKAAINATLSKIDCLLIMPTGGGKSLCFQLPAILSVGVTLVISPLIALMEDQLQGLHRLNIPAALLNAQSDKGEVKKIFQGMIDPKDPLKLLYVTPERLAKSKRFMSQLEKMYKLGRLARIVIDEVHCASAWGHDFRPDYKFLGILRRQFNGTPIIGLTATATTKVTLDVQKMLNIEGSLIFKDSFFRKNLKYEVYDVSSSDRTEDIAQLIRVRFTEQSGIIYCLTVADVENVTSKLKSLNVSCERYHAQLEPGDRTRIQKLWYNNKIRVIVATVAFGLGINKLDVRYVIHYSISKSLENFYQESGRGGRDGEEACCILFYQLQDVCRATSMMMTEKNGIQNAYNIMEYCIDRQTCRKALIARHFGDNWEGDACQGMCDNCRAKIQETRHSKMQTINAAPLLADILKILKHGDKTEQRVTVLKLMNAWFGKGEKKLRLDEVRPPKYSKTVCEYVVARLIVDGYISEEFHFTPYATISHFTAGSRKHSEGTPLNYTVPIFPFLSSSYINQRSLPVKVNGFSSTSLSDESKTGEKRKHSQRSDSSSVLSGLIISPKKFKSVTNYIDSSSDDDLVMLN